MHRFRRCHVADAVIGPLGEFERIAALGCRGGSVGRPGPGGLPRACAPRARTGGFAEPGGLHEVISGGGSFDQESRHADLGVQVTPDQARQCARALEKPAEITRQAPVEVRDGLEAPVSLERAVHVGVGGQPDELAGDGLRDLAVDL